MSYYYSLCFAFQSYPFDFRCHGCGQWTMSTIVDLMKITRLSKILNMRYIVFVVCCYLKAKAFCHFFCCYFHISDFRFLMHLYIEEGNRTLNKMAFSYKSLAFFMFCTITILMVMGCTKRLMNQ